MHPFNNQRGIIVYQVLVVSAIGLLFVGGLIVWASSNIRFGHNAYNRTSALAVAEAGIEYYRWHLAHDPLDFQDGTDEPGPYVHPYLDANGNAVGRFELEIEPPPPGSSVTTIRSTGFVDDAPLVKRVIEVIMAKPSLAKYAVAANADIRFGEGTVIYGPVHSNGGIRFDGFTYNTISSSESQYDDPDHTGGEEFGVHTHLAPTDPLPPAAVPSRPDVFSAGRDFPVPAIDFTGFTADLANIKTQAQDDGVYLPDSGELGYHITLKTDDTFDVSVVDGLVSPPNNCSSSQTGWGTWSVEDETFQGNYPIPESGAVFVEDHVWVDGQINTARITIASGRFPENPSTDTNITTNNDLLYTNYDGSDVISLIAQNNVNVGMVSEDDLRVDAALIAKNGRVGRHYYRDYWCSPYDHRDSMTLFGMIATNKRYGWAYTDGTGYTNRTIDYDGNLLYSPPPYFPQTTDDYEVLLWKEL